MSLGLQNLGPVKHLLGGPQHLADSLADLNAIVNGGSLDFTTDTRDPNQHALGGAKHSAASLAELNALISGGDVDFDSATRDPKDHAHSGGPHTGYLLATEMPTYGTWTIGGGDLTITGNDVILPRVSVNKGSAPEATDFLDVRGTSTVNGSSYAHLWAVEVNAVIQRTSSAPANVPSSGLGGYLYILGTSQPANDTYYGLSFGNAVAWSAPAGNTGIDVGGVFGAGFISVASTLTCRKSRGIVGTPYWRFIGGSLTADSYTAGFYSQVATSYGAGSSPIEYGYYGELPSEATANYQMALFGTGPGSGLWFDVPAAGTAMVGDEPRVFPSAGGTLDLAIGTATRHQVTSTSQYLGDVAGTNTTEVESDGTVKFNGNATVWEDQQVVLGTVRLGSSAPTWTAYKGGEVLAFSKSQDNKVSFNVQLSHAYKLNSSIEFHLHLAYPDANAGDSRWIFTHSWANVTGQFPAESTVTTDIASPTETDHHQIAEIAATVSGAGGDQGGISSCLICSITREGTDAVNDDYDNSIYLVALDFHIEMDTVGSRQISTK